MLRHAYRDNGKVRHRTIANLTGCPDDEIQAIRLALRHKGDLTQLASLKEHLVIKQGLAIGAVFTLFTVAKRLGIVAALGTSQHAKQAAWQVLARVIDQGSRLSAVRLAGAHAACDVLGLQAFNEDDFHYITAITKAQIEALLKRKVLQRELFEETVAEVIDREKSVRYVLRHNPIRAAEVSATRESKFASLASRVREENGYLGEHPRATMAAAVRRVEAKVVKLRLSSWVSVASRDRTVCLVRDEMALAEEAHLDGCYCLKTDLEKAEASKERVHDRYKDLAKVEWVFRTCKTVQLEVRPVNVRKETRTRGHVFVVMLAYLIVRELTAYWQKLDLTVEEGIKELSSLCMDEVTIKSETTIHQIPQPRETLEQLLDAADVELPSVLPYSGTRVYTRKKLTSERQTS